MLLLQMQQIAITDERASSKCPTSETAALYRLRKRSINDLVTERFSFSVLEANRK